jgi:hypothetical protein
MNRRNFLRLGALFVPAAAAIGEPRRVYSFIWAPTPGAQAFDEFTEIYDALIWELSSSLQIPERILRGEGSAIGAVARVSARAMGGALETYRLTLRARGTA